jgi:hypothetical protein
MHGIKESTKEKSNRSLERKHRFHDGKNLRDFFAHYQDTQGQVSPKEESLVLLNGPAQWREVSPGQMTVLDKNPCRKEVA